MADQHPDPAQNTSEWLEAYGARGKALQDALTGAIRDAFAEDRELLGARAILRGRRATFPHRFCLILYSAAFDEALYRQLMPSFDRPPSEAELAAGIESFNRPGRDSRILTLLTALLDHELGMHVVMLQRQSDTPFDGPLRIEAPDDYWFIMFGLVAELAQAVLVIGSAGRNLLQEIGYLHEAGLAGRILVFADSDLQTVETDTGLPVQTWEVSSEGLRAAVDHAAATPATAPQ